MRCRRASAALAAINYEYCRQIHRAAIVGRAKWRRCLFRRAIAAARISGAGWRATMPSISSAAANMNYTHAAMASLATSQFITASPKRVARHRGEHLLSSISDKHEIMPISRSLRRPRHDNCCVSRQCHLSSLTPRYLRIRYFHHRKSFYDIIVMGGRAADCWRNTVSRKIVEQMAPYTPLNFATHVS